MATSLIIGIIIVAIGIAISSVIFTVAWIKSVRKSRLPHFKHTSKCPACFSSNKRTNPIIIRDNGVATCSDYRYYDPNDCKTFVAFGCGFKWVEIFEDDLNQENKDSYDRMLVKDIVE